MEGSNLKSSGSTVEPLSLAALTKFNPLSIVAVHGLNPFNNPDHAFDTWRKPKGNDGKLWLRDYLPKDVPNARIFLYKYNSNPVFGATKERFVHQANDLLEGIHIERIEVRRSIWTVLQYDLISDDPEFQTTFDSYWAQSGRNTYQTGQDRRLSRCPTVC